MTGPTQRLAARLVGQWRGDPGLRRFVGAVLDRRDRNGAFPRTLKYQGHPGDLEALEKFLPRSALTRQRGHIRVDLARVGRLLSEEAEDQGERAPSLEGAFDAVAGRTARNRQAEAVQWHAEVVRAVEAGIEEGLGRVRRRGGPVDDPVAGRVAQAARDDTAARRGPWIALARAGGPDGVLESMARLVAGLALARGGGGSVRLDDLSRWVAGYTKALRPGSADHQRLADALHDGDPEVAAGVAAAGPTSAAMRRRLSLEAAGIVSNDSPVDVLVQGRLVVCVGDARLEDLGRLAGVGLAGKLTLPVLRAASGLCTEATVVTTVENESAFHTLAAVAPADEILIFTGGQASWAVVRLLTLLAAAAPLRFRHTGDLDRAGLLILRSLRHRTALAIEARWMSEAVFERCETHALPMSAGEREETERLLARWVEPYGRDLLYRLVEGGRWIEQEAILETLL